MLVRACFPSRPVEQRRLSHTGSVTIWWSSEVWRKSTLLSSRSRVTSGQSYEAKGRGGDSGGPVRLVITPLPRQRSALGTQQAACRSAGGEPPCDCTSGEKKKSL